MHRQKTKSIKNKMQSEAADFGPCAATWRTGWNIRVVFDSGLFPALYENTTSSTKPEVHYISSSAGTGKVKSSPKLQLKYWRLRYVPEEDRATATGNMCRKFGEI